MHFHRNATTICWQTLLPLIVLLVLSASLLDAQTNSKHKDSVTTKSKPVAVIDSTLLGVWGVDARGGYEFRADGTFIMEGVVNYSFDASKGVWHYWQPSMPGAKVTAEYKISADGKSLSINLKKGNPFTTLKKIK